MKIRAPRPAAAIAAGLLFAVALPFFPAVGLHSQSPPRPMLRIHPQARLVSNGAGLLVTVTVRCLGFRFGTRPYVNATQSRLIDVAHGYGDGRAPRCGHRWAERRRILIVADDKPFLPGTAIVEAHLYACGGPSKRCRQVRDIGQVEISPLDLLPVRPPV